MMNYPPPEQDELDLRLARAVYGRVCRRWCCSYFDSGLWEVWTLALTPEAVATGRWVLLWCYVPDPRYPRDWAPVPAFGQDGGRMLAALERYAARVGGAVRIERMIGGGWAVGLRQASAEGSTFALAARAAILAMEERQHG